MVANAISMAPNSVFKGLIDKVKFRKKQKNKNTPKPRVTSTAAACHCGEEDETCALFRETLLFLRPLWELNTYLPGVQGDATEEGSEHQIHSVRRTGVCFLA